MIAVIKIKIKVFPYTTAIENVNQIITVIEIKINTFFIVKLFRMQDFNKNSLTTVCENTVIYWVTLAQFEISMLHNIYVLS